MATSAARCAGRRALRGDGEERSYLPRNGRGEAADERGGVRYCTTEMRVCSRWLCESRKRSIADAILRL